MRTTFLHSLQKRLEHQTVGVIAALIFGTLCSAAVIGLRGIPAPRVHDEFCYLLSADTFANGRVTNPTHPMWNHFESFHIIHQPSYNAKYPPLQGLTLAIGQWLGHPIIGVCLATGSSIAALVWMLYGWLPENCRPVAWLFAVLHPGFHFQWSHSYMGGAVAIAGAALLLGAFIRLSGSFKLRHAGLAALGILLLANSRPFEGLVLTIAVAIGLLVRLIRESDWQVGPFLIRVIAPTAVVLSLGIGAMLAYNSNVTGDPLKMPYQVYEGNYGWNSLFIWQRPKNKPDYLHPEMELFYLQDKIAVEQSFATFDKTLIKKAQVALILAGFFSGPLLVTAFFGAYWNRQPRLGFAVAFLIPVFLAATLSNWSSYHYAAPAAPLFIVCAIAGTFAAWQRLAFDPRWQRMLVLVMVTLQLVWSISVISETGKIHRGNWGRQRLAAIKELESIEGNDLVLVRYTQDHIVCQEWVYNDASIDDAPIVWAREINPERRRDLLQYFSNRKVWVLVADRHGYQLEPYSEEKMLDNRQFTTVSTER